MFILTILTTTFGNPAAFAIALLIALGCLEVCKLLAQTKLLQSWQRRKLWVQSSIQKFGGRGGGKSANAQGSVAVGTDQSVESIIDTIRQSATSYLSKVSV